jgi:hypothetical protein
MSSNRITSDEHTNNTLVASSAVSIKDIIESKYCLDMRGNEYWGKKVDALRKILKAAAPNSQRPEWMPAYSFAPYYYVIDGEWYEGTWQRFPAVSPLDVDW